MSQICDEDTGMKILKASSVARRLLYDLIVPLSVGFVLVAIGMYFVLLSVPLVQGTVMMTPSGQQLEVVTDHQIFRDVLQTVLAVAAIGITAFGVGAYRLLSSQIGNKVRKRIEARYLKSLAYHRAALGYMNWILYENSKPQPDIAKIYLDEAIRHTRVAYDENAVNLDARETEYEHLICQVRNNLAFFISEKHIEFGPLDATVKAECLSFANWLEARIDNHPTDAHEYRDTIDTVMQCFATSD